MKTILQAALIVAAAAPAQAMMYRAAAMPSAPLRLPTAVLNRGVALPSYMPVRAITLPSIMPISAPAMLPGAKIVTPLKRDIALPTMRLPFAGRASLAGFQAAKSDDKDNARKAEKLNRLYDQGQDNRRAAEKRDDRPHTLPESDLLNEIGVGTYY